MATVIDFLNVTKYPPSLLFLMMTLGPAAISARSPTGSPVASGMVKGVLMTFGRAPFAFYVAHLYLLHLLSVLLGVLQGFSLDQTMTSSRFYPGGSAWACSAVFVVWALVVILLYPLCHWVAGVKARRRDWWLSYV